MWKQSGWQITINEIHRFLMNVKLHSSFISRASHLFISSLISEKNLHLMHGSSCRVSQKMEVPLSEHSLGKFHNYMTLYCPGIVFFNIQKMSQKYIGILISMKCFVPAHYWKMQFVHNIAACLKNRQVSIYQPLAFELKAFSLGTPVAFPQHVLLDFNKQIAQITQRQL